MFTEICLMLEVFIILFIPIYLLLIGYDIFINILDLFNND